MRNLCAFFENHDKFIEFPVARACKLDPMHKGDWKLSLQLEQQCDKDPQYSLLKYAPISYVYLHNSIRKTDQ